MSKAPSPVADTDRRSGCLASWGGLLGIVILAPAALVIRAVRALRRGNQTRLRRDSSSFSGGQTRIAVDIDVPEAGVGPFRPILTDAVIRVAELLRCPDDVYHLVYREAALDETTLLPVGPQLQELGERFHLVMSQTAMVRRTAVWMTLGRGRRLAELIDPNSYDPEAGEEPDALLARSGMRWGMATSFAPSGPSTLFRVVFFVPDDAVPAIDALIDRLGDQVESVGGPPR